jgi:HlyD family secretion protein
MRLQQTELSARTSVLSAQRGALGQRVLQSGEQGRGYGEQAVSSTEQLRLIEEQIAALKPVADKGFVSATRMRELERARAQLQGQRGQYNASVAQTRGAARENEIQVLEAERTFRERTASDLRDVETRLGDVLPRWTAARDQLERTAIRSPATGAVVGLSVFTPGGVVAPGQKLMDVVPERTPLLIQARISPEDADDLQVGQRTLVKFSGLHERTLPNLEGRLTRLSADSFTDEKSGMSYFTGEITVPREQLNLIQGVRGADFALRAGMPVQVLIPLRRRTALDYALEPLIGSFWSSFREH